MKLYRDRLFFVLTTLVLMYLVTILQLLILALIVYRLSLAAWVAQLGVTLAYVISGYFGGFMLGRQIHHKRFYWGMGIGSLYFLTLLIASLVANGGVLQKGWACVLIFVLCTCSAVCGEMTRK